MRAAMTAVLALALCSAMAHAAALPPADSTSLAGRAEISGEPLVVTNRTVFVFRTPFGSNSARERRVNAERRTALAIGNMQLDSVHITHAPEGDLLSYGALPLFTVIASDVDSANGDALSDLSARTAQRAGDAISAGIEQRNPRYLVTHGLIAVGITLLALLLLRLMQRGHDLMLKWLHRASAERLERLAESGTMVPGRDRVGHLVGRVADTTMWVGWLALGYLWLSNVLRQFPYTAPWGNALRHYLVDAVVGVLVGVLHALPGLGIAGIIFMLARMANGLVTAFFTGIEQGTARVPWMHPDVAQPTRLIVVVLVWLFAALTAYPYLPGSSTALFQGATVFFGLLVSLGSSGVMSQIMGGLVLMYSRAFKLGEYVSIGEVEGHICSVGMLSTKLITRRNEEITFPNAAVVGSTIKNYSRLAAERGLMLPALVTIGYDVPWRQVHAMLIQAAGRTAGLSHDPPPFVLQTALSDFFIEYTALARIENPDARYIVLSAWHQNILDAFNEQGVQIMSPHYEGDRATPAVVPKAKWFSAPAGLPPDSPPIP